MKLNSKDVGKRFMYNVANNYDEAYDKAMNELGIKEIPNFDPAYRNEAEAFWKKFEEVKSKYYWEKISEVVVVEVTSAGRFVRVQDKGGLTIEFTYNPRTKDYRMTTNHNLILEEI